jgi:hypothetical protein
MIIGYPGNALFLETYWRHKIAQLPPRLGSGDSATIQAIFQPLGGREPGRALMDGRGVYNR